MPDWYVKRNAEGNPYPYAIRLGGCEYSLTEEEFHSLLDAFVYVDDSTHPCCIESEAYQDLVIASGNEKRSLSSIMGQTPREPMKRRI